jgi:hypothetical protein
MARELSASAFHHPYPIQWTTKTEPIAAVEQLGDKLAQVTGEWKAVEDYFNEEISGALVVVAIL